MSREADNINPARLAELAGRRDLKSGAIARLFGCGRANFFTYLSQHDELWNIYAKARLRAGHQVTKAHLLSKRGTLTQEDLRIINAISSGRRTRDEIAVYAEIEPRIFDARLYNLENEKHEIWSAQVGRPPVTNYFLRGEAESVKGAAA